MVIYCKHLVFIAFAILVLRGASLCARAGEAPAPDPDALLDEDPSYAEQDRVNGPPGKRFMVASKVIGDGNADEKRLLTLQVMDLSLITRGKVVRPPKHFQRLAYLLVESSCENPMEGKLLGLEYGHSETLLAAIRGDIVYDAQHRRVYVLRYVRTEAGSLRFSVSKADLGEPTEVPKFDLAQVATWPTPTMIPIGKEQRISAPGRITLTACYDKDRLLLHAVSEKDSMSEERRILLALDLKTLKWSRLDVEMKELEDQSFFKF